MDQNLLNYIKENLAKGVPQDQIRQALITSGWQPADIEAAFSQLQSPQPSTPPIQQPISTKHSFNLKFLIIGILVLILLASAAAGAYLFFNNKTSPQSTLTDNNLSSDQKTQSIFDKAKNAVSGGRYSGCFAQFDDHLLPQLPPYQRSTVEKIDPYPDQDPNQLGSKRREISAPYFDSTATLNVNIAEFLDHKTIEANINKLEDSKINRDPSKVESISMKNIRDLEVYLVKETSNSLGLISHVPKTNVRISFLFAPSIDNSRAEEIFSGWLTTVCGLASFQ